MLTIIIPYYKILFFEETLKSIANQTDKRFKVFIGDDASLEDPTDLLNKYKKSFYFQYHRFNQNLGKISLTQHWERCIEFYETEDWIMILGDDDVLANNFVENFYLNLPQFSGKTNVVRFGTKTVNEKLGKTSESFLHPKWETASDSCFRKIKRLTRSSLSEYIYLKESYLKYKFHNYPLAWHSDDMAWIDFCEEKPIFTINESFVFIRVSENSISGKEDNDILKNKAQVAFLKDLLLKKIHLFNKSQRLDLLLRYEIEIKKKHKENRSDYFLLFKLYLVNFSFMPFLKFIKRSFRTSI